MACAASRTVFVVEFVKDGLAIEHLAPLDLIKAELNLLADFGECRFALPLLSFQQPERGTDHLARRLVPAGGHPRVDKGLELGGQGDVHCRLASHTPRIPRPTSGVNLCWRGGGRSWPRRLK